MFVPIRPNRIIIRQTLDEHNILLSRRSVRREIQSTMSLPYYPYANVARTNDPINKTRAAYICRRTRKLFRISFTRRNIFACAARVPGENSRKRNPASVPETRLFAE